MSPELAVKSSPQIEPKSTSHLLDCLGLAIDETKLLRSLTRFRDMATNLSEDDVFAGKLTYVNRQIEMLEARLLEVRARANKF